MGFKSLGFRSKGLQVQRVEDSSVLRVGSSVTTCSQPYFRPGNNTFDTGGDLRFKGSEVLGFGNPGLL